jgi:hypothetical protein
MQVSQSASERVPEASAKTDTKRISASSATLTKVLEDAIATNVLSFLALVLCAGLLGSIFLPKRSASLCNSFQLPNALSFVVEASFRIDKEALIGLSDVEQRVNNLAPPVVLGGGGWREDPPASSLVVGTTSPPQIASG